jgi:hypothetical protein
VPLLGLWGAALGGLVVMVMPSALVRAALAGTLVGTWDFDAQPFLAAACALLLGLLMLVLASVLHARARARVHLDKSAISMVEMAMRDRVTPINPARDLGSRSLDDPLEAMPFAAPASHAEPASVQEAAPAPEPKHEPELNTVPVELDLAQFAQLPSRNGVWVEELPTMAPPEAAPAAPQPDPVADIRARRRRAVAPPPPGTAALARLRAVPTTELSLAEMVERFAGALHEHRETPPVRGQSAADLAAREASLAEALRALAALSGKVAAATQVADGEDPLRAALVQLQPQRGVA